jgi:hypothetical protein
MNPLELLDPTRPDDPAFDPRGEQAQRVRTAAMRAAADRAPGRRPRPLVLGVALVAAAVAAAVGAVVVLSSLPPTSARAALQEAVARTRAVASGRIVRTVEIRPPATRESSIERHVVRFDADGDLEWVERARLELDEGWTVTVHRTFREIHGQGWTRDDTKPGARFEALGATSDQDFPHQLVEQVGSPALVALVRDASDLSPQTGPDGSTTYRAETTAGRVEDAAPSAAGRAPGGAWSRRVTLSVTVDERGFVRRVVVASPGVTMSTEYTELGEPQRIDRP